MEAPIIKEELVDAVYYLDEVKEEDKKEIIAALYRTKEKNIIAYLMARGYKIRGMEKLVLINGQGRKKMIIQFCFDSKEITRRAVLEYYNTDDCKYFNVNAKRVLQEFKNVNSLIANF